MSAEQRTEFLWQWWYEPGERWEDHATSWPSEYWARKNAPFEYGATDGVSVRLVERTISDHAIEEPHCRCDAQHNRRHPSPQMTCRSCGGLLL